MWNGDESNLIPVYEIVRIQYNLHKLQEQRSHGRGFGKLSRSGVPLLLLDGGCLLLVS